MTMMKKYKTRSVTISAMEWTGKNADYITKHTGEATTIKDGELYINTPEGTMRATPGDFIIQGLAGEFYPCKPEIFHQKYTAFTMSQEDRAIERKAREAELLEMAKAACKNSLGLCTIDDKYAIIDLSKFKAEFKND